MELKKLLKKEYTIEKPLKKSNLTHSVVKRIASGVKVKEVKNGFSAIIQTKNGEPPIKRNRKCLEWFKIELINRWKCITVQFSSGKIIELYWKMRQRTLPGNWKFHTYLYGQITYDGVQTFQGMKKGRRFVSLRKNLYKKKKNCDIICHYQI